MAKRSTDRKEALERIFLLTSKIRKLNQIRATSKPMEEELSDAKFLILSALDTEEKEAMVMGELAKETGITPSHLSRIMRELEFKLHYVARERGKKDLRSVTVKLAPAGRKALKAYQAAHLSHYQKILDRCSAKELELLGRAITVFEAKVDDVLKNLEFSSQEEGSE